MLLKAKAGLVSIKKKVSNGSIITFWVKPDTAKKWRSKKESAYSIEQKYKGQAIIELHESEKNNELALSMISIDKEYRGKGLGTKIMQDIVDYADRSGKLVTLTPVTMGRLKVFYKRFGFVENKGKNRNASTGNTMYRPLKDNK